MSALAIPADLFRIRERSFRLAPRSLGSTGLFSQALRPYGPVSRRWTADLEFTALEETRWPELDAIVADLGGRAGTLRAHDPARARPQYDGLATETTTTWDGPTTWDDGTGWAEGTLPPSVAVGAAAVRGATDLQLAFGSGFASLSAVLRRGDLIEIQPAGIPADHGHLYMATSVANTDTSGGTGLSIVPPLRAGIAAGDKAVLRNPSTVFHLASDDVGDISVDPAGHGRTGLTLVEALPR